MISRRFKILTAILCLTGCNEAEMGANSKKDIFVGTTKPKNCDDTGASTAAKLLSDSFSSSPSLQEIIYEVSLVNCEGDNIMVNDLPIYFDINLMFTNNNGQGEIADLRYRIETTKGEKLSEGSMPIVRGSDLFGKVSDDYYYWKTASVDNVDDVKKIKFIVVVSGYNTSTFKGLSENSVDTYLSIGKAQPLKKEVKFIP